MNYRLVNTGNCTYLECLPGCLLDSERTALDLLAACGENGTSNLLIYATNLSEDFYRLRTGLAGEILQKFATYRIRVAAVLTPELVNQGRFREMVLEANRGNQFRVFYNDEDAVKWLGSGKLAPARS